MKGIVLKKIWGDWVGLFALLLGVLIVMNFLEIELAVGATQSAQPASLEQQMQELAVPENKLPINVSQEKLYAVQSRYAPLSKRHEFNLGGSKAVTAENFLVSYQLAGSYRYHFNDRLSLGFNGSYVFNDLSDAAKRLIKKEQLVPDVAYAKYILDTTFLANLFYAKFRISMEQVLYFDQYVALGLGAINMDRGWKPAVVGDIGFAFWIKRNLNVRLGLKDYFHSEQLRNSSSMVHTLLGHLDLGILLGGDQG